MADIGQQNGHPLVVRGDLETAGVLAWLVHWLLAIPHYVVDLPVDRAGDHDRGRFLRHPLRGSSEQAQDYPARTT